MSEPKLQERVFWVLERVVNGWPVYWDGGHAGSFTRDIHKAVLWYRRDDALHCCEPRHYAQWGWQYVEHTIMGSAMAMKEPEAVGAVDPSDGSAGTPSTRVKESQ